MEKVKVMVLANCRTTIREVDEKIEISYGSCETIFTNVLNMKRMVAKFVPKLLNFQQKKHGVTFAEQMPANVDDDPDLFKHVITGDETITITGYSFNSS